MAHRVTVTPKRGDVASIAVDSTGNIHVSGWTIDVNGHTDITYREVALAILDTMRDAALASSGGAAIVQRQRGKPTLTLVK